MYHSFSKPASEYNSTSLLEPGPALLSIDHIEQGEINGKPFTFTHPFMCVHFKVFSDKDTPTGKGFHDLFWLTTDAEWRIAKLIDSAECSFSDNATVFFDGLIGRFIVGEIGVSSKSSKGKQIQVNEIISMRQPKQGINAPKIDLSLKIDFTIAAPDRDDSLPF